MTVLFLLHETSATGAPRVALNLVKRVASLGIRCFYATLKRGELEAEINKYSTYVDLGETSLVSQEASVLYFNTIETLEYLKYTSSSKASRILHMHELTGTCLKCGVDNISKLIDSVDHIVVPSLCLKNNVYKLFNPSAPVNVSYPLDLYPDIWLATQKPISLTSPLTVLAVGEVSLGKGVDTFVQAAIDLAQREEIQFKWIGGNYRDQLYYLKLKIEQSGRCMNELFTGYLADPWKDIQPNTLFVHCSREDSFPLVVLEAIRIGLPVLWRSNAHTGLNEYLTADNSFLFQEDSSNSLSTVISEIYDHPIKIRSPLDGIRKLVDLSEVDPVRLITDKLHNS